MCRRDERRRYHPGEIRDLRVFGTHGEAFSGRCAQPLCAAFSADGINWAAARGWVNPVIPGGTDTQAALYWDAARRKYRVYLRGRPNIRVMAVAESDDFIDWTERQVIVAPDELDPPQDHEFYGMSSMVYRGFRIGFLSVFHVLYEGIVAREGLPGQKT